MAFVLVGNGRDGIGRVLSLGDSTATVEYFLSPAGPVTHVIETPKRLLRGIELPNESLVYWHDDEQLTWRIGRTQGVPVDRRALKGAEEDHYSVRFPNKDSRLIPVSELRIRWAHPIEDPSDLVAERVTESPFFVAARRQLGRFLATQRSACRGIAGLTSSAIQYHPHQVAIVRRVLSDPVQRYILADEVGLGKTIEAGVLIKQHLIENPESSRVDVLVPHHLRQQWDEELSTKFYLRDSDRVRVTTVADLDHLGSAVTMLVVDEAHNVARWAYSSDSKLRLRFQELARRAGLADKVFLLSATPVLSDEDGFLAMLHLIDPIGHPLSERERFRQRVRARQVVANSLADLTDEAAELFVEDALSGLEQAFSDDHELVTRSGSVRRVLSEPENSPSRIAAIQALRSYLSETYKLHRRLLRTRREDKTVADLLPSREGLKEIDVEDRARMVADEFIEDWRDSLSADGSTTQAQDLVAGWVAAALSHPAVLSRCLDERLAALENGVASAFPSEKQMLESWAMSFGEALQKEPRAHAVGEWCFRENRRAVVFIDDPLVAEEVARVLRERWGENFALRYGHDEGDALALFQGEQVAVLVVDREHEEGLNLQEQRAGIFLYDMPMSPQRLEQRIGRFDRLEGLARLWFYGFVPRGRYEVAWRRYLQDAAKVFSRSIAPLQYVLAESTSSVGRRFIEDGPMAIDLETERLASEGSDGLDAELRRIRSQEALDSFERDLQEESDYVERLDAAAALALRSGRRVLEAWMCRGLQFQSRGQEVFHLIHHSPGRWSRPSLLTLFEVMRFKEFVDPAERRATTELPLGPFSFDREAANETGAHFLGFGHPFLREVERQLKEDVRGVSWALWRQTSSRPVDGLQLYLGFDLVIEVGSIGIPDQFLEVIRSPQALRLLADGVFAPFTLTVWVDIDGEVVTDKELLDLLDSDYHAASRGGTDVNLRSERWLRVEDLRPMTSWADVCRSARRLAEQTVRESQLMQGRQEKGRSALRRRLGRIEAVLRNRALHLDGAARAAELQAVAQEQELTRVLEHAVAHPQIRVDSAGAIALSNDPFA